LGLVNNATLYLRGHFDAELLKHKERDDKIRVMNLYKGLAVMAGRDEKPTIETNFPTPKYVLKGLSSGRKVKETPIATTTSPSNESKNKNNRIRQNTLLESTTSREIQYNYYDIYRLRQRLESELGKEVLGEYLYLVENEPDVFDSDKSISRDQSDLIRELYERDKDCRSKIEAYQ
jgi:hypothetical protein